MIDIDPRFVENDAIEDPEEWLQANFAVIIDNFVAGCLRRSDQVDSKLRRSGLTGTADRLIEMLGERWWERATKEAS